MVGDLADSSAGRREDLYHRYLQLIIDGLRAGPHNSQLGKPLSRNDLETVIAEHVPAIEARRR